MTDVAGDATISVSAEARGLVAASTQIKVTTTATMEPPDPYLLRGRATVRVRTKAILAVFPPVAPIPTPNDGW